MRCRDDSGRLETTVRLPRALGGSDDVAECRARRATTVDVTRAWRASKRWRDEVRKAASCKERPEAQAAAPAVAGSAKAASHAFAEGRVGVNVSSQPSDGKNGNKNTGGFPRDPYQPPGRAGTTQIIKSGFVHYARRLISDPVAR